MWEVWIDINLHL